MEFKGTKGEWNITKSKKGSWFFVNADLWSELARIPRKVDGFLDKEGECNAKLIAAAPELLEALQDLVKYCEENETHAELELAKEAINKALN